MAIGNKNIEALMMRIAPTSIALRPNNPFLIRIKELPHINDSSINRLHESTFGFLIMLFKHSPADDQQMYGQFPSEGHLIH